MRIAIPLAALAASGSKLPGLPRYDYVAFTGDANGFYAAAREFLSALASPVSLAAGVALLVVLALLWRERRRGAPIAIAAVLALSLALVVPISRMHPPGAAVFGWPLVWSVPLLPLRALGLLTPNAAFVPGLVLSLAANAATVVATAYAGLWATGRRGIGIAAAAVFAFWPLLAAFVAGTSAWGNGTWAVDAGLVMYTEPLSTALMAVALALLLRPARGDRGDAAAGLAIGLATAVKLSNGLVGLVALPLVWHRRGRRAALLYAAAALAWAPVVGAYWPKGYQAQFDNPSSWPRHPFAFGWIGRNWSDSLLFTPRALIVLVPLALLGALALRRRSAVLLLAVFVLVNVAFYSLYRVTWEHPRFLFASLPALFVLWAAGVGTKPLRSSA